jgi:hypothetical protein
MSHRVIQFQAKVTSESKAGSLKNDIESKLNNKGYDLYEQSVADGQGMDGNATVACTTKHNLTSEADEFSSWLKSWMDTNQASFNQDGTVNTEGITWVRHKVHDCYHLVNKDEPCEVQDYKSWDIRPEE